MTMMNVALAAVIGVLVAAGSLVAAPAAKADIDFECKPGCWGALAASPSNGQEEIVTNATTQKKRRTKPSCGAMSLASERLPCNHIGTGLSLARGEQRRENVSGASRAHPRRG